MDKLREIDRKRFPLRTIDDVIGLFEDQLNPDFEPNLTLLSIVLGLVEHSLTVNKPLEKRPRGRPNEKIKANEIDTISKENIPIVELDDVKLLFELFVKLVKANVDFSQFDHKQYTSTGLLKKVSDVLWNTLSRTFYKDKGHLQFLYTLFNEKKMDCIGMAFGVICGCQVLGLQDVHLAVSEDHVWAVYGKNGSLTSEITWHGKGTEDRRGYPISSTALEKSWLYESPMICDRHMEAATLVAGINPIINSCSESLEMAIIQQKLLWSLHDRQHLEKYPLALGVLADLEEIHPTPGRPSSLKLYKRAIEISLNHYDNAHIYPHTYLGNYYYRRRKYKDALRCWADAAQVSSRFNYNREDDEIYREFNEIANDIMPNIIKTCCAIQDGLVSNNSNIQGINSSSNSEQYDENNKSTIDSSAEKSKETKLQGKREQDNALLLSDSKSYADVLRFFDGICEWEEGSSMPVLHIIWAKNMSYTISKFLPVVRTSLEICLMNKSDDKQTKIENLVKTIVPSERSSKKKQRNKDSNESTGEEQSIGVNKVSEHTAGSPEIKDVGTEVIEQIKSMPNDGDNLEDVDKDGSDNNNTDIIIAQISLEPQDMETDAGGYGLEEFKGLETNNAELSRIEKLSEPESNFQKNYETVMNADVQIAEDADGRRVNDAEKVQISVENGKLDDDPKKPEEDWSRVKLILRSHKMASMKDLLISERLNLSAIKLLLTAQSQVNAKPTILPSARSSIEGGTPNQPPRKRVRID